MSRTILPELHTLHKHIGSYKGGCAIFFSTHSQIMKTVLHNYPGLAYYHRLCTQKAVGIASARGLTAGAATAAHELAHM